MGTLVFQELKEFLALMVIKERKGNTAALALMDFLEFLEKRAM
jgi:hypothetical protein